MPTSTGESSIARADVPGDPARDLIRRMAGGDESALATLYDRWAERVHAVAFWILKDADEAEDVVEETFWQAWKTAARYDGVRGAGSTWLILIARSRALDRLRARRRRDRLNADARTFADGESDATALSGMAEHSARLSEALGALPAEQRQVLELAFFQGLSHTEIATRTGHPLGTVKTRIRLAMDKLRQRLASLQEVL